MGRLGQRGANGGPPPLRTRWGTNCPEGPGFSLPFVWELRYSAERTGWTQISKVQEGSIYVAEGALASIRRRGGCLLIRFSLSFHILQSHGGVPRQSRSPVFTGGHADVLTAPTAGKRKAVSGAGVCPVTSGHQVTTDRSPGQQ